MKKIICLLLASTTLGACAGSPAASHMAKFCISRSMKGVQEPSANSPIEVNDAYARAYYNALASCDADPESVAAAADLIVVIGKVKAGEMTRDELRAFWANRLQQANADFVARNNDTVRAGAAWTQAWNSSRPTNVYVVRK